MDPAAVLSATCFALLAALAIYTLRGWNTGENMAPPTHLKRGAKPSPRHRLLAAEPHVVIEAPPPQFAVVPRQLSMWGNQDWGDCVSASEAFAKAVYALLTGQAELFVPEAEVIRWATQYGFLNGANLVEVMDQMAKDGFNVNGVNYKDGPSFGVNYADITTLQSAITVGAVKIAIDANALPSGAGSQMGWFAVGGTPGQFPNTDHCVSISAFGPAGWLYQQLGVPLPAGLDPATPGFLIFTWNTMGFVDHAWLMSTCVEAWVRNPTTTGQPAPGPGPAPAPKVLFTFTPRRSVPVHGSVTLANLPVALKGGVAYPVLDPTAKGAPSGKWLAYALAVLLWYEGGMVGPPPLPPLGVPGPHDPMQDLLVMMQASLTKMDYMRGTVNNAATVLDYTRAELAALTRADTAAPAGAAVDADVVPG